jgi:hypothetical protein
MELSFNHDKWLYYLKSRDKLQQLNSYYPCKFCRRHENCYYDEELFHQNSNDIFKYRYYICQESYEQVRRFKDKIMLIYFLLSENLNFDLNNIIYTIIYHLDVEISCIVSKEKDILYRLSYLNYSFDNFTLNQLKVLVIKRNLRIKSNKKQAYITELQNDLYQKKQLWSNDDIGL